MPRPPAEISDGDGEGILNGWGGVVDAEGKDVTAYFIKGAFDVLAVAKTARATKAVLKEKSPSCGVYKIYRNGAVVPGAGELTALIKRERIEVISDEVV